MALKVKPSNIWLEGKRGWVKILDFGLARAVEDDAHLTGFGLVAGTPRYMAPEQASGEAFDARCDLFSQIAAEEAVTEPGRRHHTVV